jgi:hypothetical protein
MTTSFAFDKGQRQRLTKLVGVSQMDVVQALDRMEQHAKRYYHFVRAVGRISAAERIPGAVRLSQAHLIIECAVMLYNQLSYLDPLVQKAMVQLMALFQEPMKIAIAAKGPPLNGFASAVEDLAFAADGALRAANEQTWSDTYVADRELRLPCKKIKLEWEGATGNLLPGVTLALSSENTDDRCSLAFPHVIAEEHPLQLFLRPLAFESTHMY